VRFTCPASILRLSSPKEIVLLYALMKFSTTRDCSNAVQGRRFRLSAAHAGPNDTPFLGLDEHLPLVKVRVGDAGRSPLLHDLDYEKLAHKRSV